MTDAVPAALLQTKDGPLIVSVGSCRNSSYPTYSVSSGKENEEVAFDCGA